MEQLGPAGDILGHGEGGAGHGLGHGDGGAGHGLVDGGAGHRGQMVRSVSHQDSLGRNYPPDIQLDRQHQAMSSDCVADRQVMMARAGSQDSLGGGRSEVGLPKSYGEGGPTFKPAGEGMTAAMESLANVRMPFPPVPKLDQFQAQFGGGGQPHQYGGGQGSHYGGGGLVPQYGGGGPGYQQYQHQYPEITPSYGGDTHQDQGWRLPQYKRREVDPSTHNPTSMGNTQPTWTRPDQQQERWKGMGAPLAQSMGPPMHCAGYPGGLGPMGGMGMVGWQDRERFGRDDCGSGISRESSRDDINSECEQQFEYEQRFRVDRRKLEMMMTNSPEFGEAAAEFFERIGAETDTCVIWPSRLKIGAKSKKDPHIRVGGQEEGVKRAKMLITEVLDTTTNSRVTMKMDVSYTDHSHIIGKGGNTIRRVMAETNCHIHFPDSNRSNPNEKSNQVSVFPPTPSYLTPLYPPGLHSWGDGRGRESQGQGAGADSTSLQL